MMSKLGEMVVESGSKASWLIHVVVGASRVLPEFFTLFT